MIHSRVRNTGGPKKNLPVCFLAITTSNLHQIQKGRSVLKSARSEDFKTDLTFDFWPSWSWKNWGQRHQGSFSVFTFSGNLKSFFWVISTKNSKKSISVAFFGKSLVICVENIKESKARCQIDALKVQKSGYNCWKWIIPYIFMWKMKMTPGVFDLNFSVAIAT